MQEDINRGGEVPNKVVISVMVDTSGYKGESVNKAFKENVSLVASSRGQGCIGVTSDIYSSVKQMYTTYYLIKMIGD